MGLAEECLPEPRDEILDRRARLQIILKERGATREAEIAGNRKGWQALAAICSGLAELTPTAAALPAANHYHLDEYFWGIEKGSVALIVLGREDGSPESSE
jgi:hypothetical protein